MRINDAGPDPLSADGKTYHVKINGIYNDSTGGMTVEQVYSLVQPTDPGRISSAGGTYQNAGRTLSEQVNSLLGHAQKLAGAWGGSSADNALGQMKQLHQTATNLANAAHSVASALQQHAPVLSQYKKQIQDLYDRKQKLKAQLQQARQDVANESLLTKIGDALTGSDPRQARVDSLASQAAQLDVEATRQLAALNGHIMNTYNQLPTSVSQNLPPA
jgi:WXG100 family type VII secretion target